MTGRALGRDRSGLAAVEFALIAPVLIVFALIVADLGIGLHQWSQVQAAVAAGAEYATLAGQSASTVTTIAGEVPGVVAAASNTLLSSGNVTVTVNNGAPTTSTCCLTAVTPGVRVWVCTNPAPVCADGSNPGVYVEVAASYAFKPIIATASLANTTLRGDLIRRIR